MELVNKYHKSYKFLYLKIRMAILSRSIKYLNHFNMAVLFFVLPPILKFVNWKKNLSIAIVNFIHQPALNVYDL